MIEFVERPTQRRRGSERIAALKATAHNGKAILGKRNSMVGGYSARLKKDGYRVHSSIIGAPEGMAFGWTTLIEDEVTQ